MVNLSRRNGVQLARVGTWATSTGLWNATAEDFAAAVAAQRECPAVRRPVLKIGHQDDRFTPGDGEPAIGWVDALRVEGDALVGDWVGMPTWLNEVAASAWPDRSIEGRYNHRCQLGHTHRFVLTGVALLGVTPPGVGTLQSLQDVADLFGVSASHATSDEETLIVATIRAAAGDMPAGGQPTNQGEAAPQHTGAMVALIPTAEDAARLAAAGGEPADELHVTLAYLGNADQLDAAARQAIIQRVTAWAAGAETIEGTAFGAAMLNPPNTATPDGEPPETCVVLLVGGEGLADLHHRIGCALEDCCADGDADLPDQHDPWLSHLTLAYTADQAMVATAAQLCGPVTFDRLRIALADQTIDIPLIEDAEDDGLGLGSGDMAGLGWDTPTLAAAGEAAHPVSAERLHAYWTVGKGREKWVHAVHRWTALYRNLRKYIKDPEEAKRTAANWFHDALGIWPGSKANKVHAAAQPGSEQDGSNLDGVLSDLLGQLSEQDLSGFIAAVVQALAQDQQSQVAAAAGSRFAKLEAELRKRGAKDPGALAAWIGRKKYGAKAFRRLAMAGRKAVAASTVGTVYVDVVPRVLPTIQPAAGPDPNNPQQEEGDMPLSELRERLGLADDADETAVLAAVDDLKTRAEQQVTASAAAVAKNDELTQKVALLGEQLQQVSEQLAAVNAEKVATIKASVLDGAQAAGKFAPADRDAWAARYDQAPQVVTEVLASIAAGTAVPVSPLGRSGSVEASAGDDDSEFDRLFPPTVAAAGGTR